MKQHLYRTSAASERSLKRNLLAAVSSKELVPDLSKNAYQVSFLYHNKEHHNKSKEKNMHTIYRSRVSVPSNGKNTL